MCSCRLREDDEKRLARHTCKRLHEQRDLWRLIHHPSQWEFFFSFFSSHSATTSLQDRWDHKNVYKIGEITRMEIHQWQRTHVHSQPAAQLYHQSINRILAIKIPSNCIIRICHILTTHADVHNISKWMPSLWNNHRVSCSFFRWATSHQCTSADSNLTS